MDSAWQIATNLRDTQLRFLGDPNTAEALESLVIPCSCTAGKGREISSSQGNPQPVATDPGDKCFSSHPLGTHAGVIPNTPQEDPVESSSCCRQQQLQQCPLILLFFPSGFTLPAPSSLYPGVTFQIHYLHPSLCLKGCFQGNSSQTG